MVASRREPDKTHAPRPQRRATRQRAAISEVLRQAGGFRTAQELHEDLRRGGQPVGLTTVYRELQKLADAGEIDALVKPAGETIYRLCNSHDHHHHLVCRACGVSVEVESEAVEEWAQRTATAHGFRDVIHTAEVFGVCGDCSK